VQAAWGRRGAGRSKGGLRKINVGVSVSPPNVVHTSLCGKELGIFAKHCIDANIIQSMAAISGRHRGGGARHALANGQRCRDRPRHEGEAALGGSRRGPRRFTRSGKTSRPRPTSKGKRLSAAAAASAASLAHGPRGAAHAGLDVADPSSFLRAPRPPAGLVAGQLRCRRAASRRTSIWR